MNHERFLRLREIVLTAAALPAEERPAYLDRTCAGESNLRSDAESLLAHEPISSPAGCDEAVSVVIDALRESMRSTPHRSLPERIGPYRVLGILGEGGMGTVYHAEQITPIRREVALKLIRDGADSASVIARFEMERQTLAQMDHPNIARVLDAGSDDQGRPYFVMELVRGVPITAYCQTEKLGTRERLRLLLDVCRAVSHAQRRGVIHRDLKPSNILVALHRGGPVPKVIDFSIARSLLDPAIGTEFRTRTGQILGTLEYMSPEQARGEVSHVDVRSDVYALGVVAYELLTGRLPHDTRGQALHEAVRRIAEEPHHPLRTAGTTTTGTGRIDGDVETIVGKCLEKEPDRRYGSAGELAEDLERYLDSRPILAHAPSTLYQIRKLVGRHRVAFGVAALAFIFLAAFAVTVTLQLRVQRAERARAEAAARHAVQERRKSDRVVAFMTRLLGSAIPGEAGGEATIVEALEFMKPAIEEELADEPQIAAAVLTTAGAVYRERGLYDEAEAVLNEALELRLAHLDGLHPDVAWSYLELANLRHFQERLDDSEAYSRQALEIFESQDEPDPAALANVLNTLGLALRLGGRLAESEPVLRRAVEQYRAIPDPTRQNRMGTATVTESLAGVLRRLGQYHEAETLMQEVVEAKRELNPGSSGESTALYNHASVLGLLGRHRDAEQLYRDCLAIEEKHYGADNPWTLITVTQIADTALALGRHEEAEGLVRKAIAGHRVAPERFRRWLAQDLATLARVLASAGRPEEAEAAGREAVATSRDAMGIDHPVTATTLIAYGRALGAGEQWALAEESLSEAEGILREKVGDDNPQLAQVLALRSRCLRKLGRLEEALRLGRDAADMTRRTLDDQHPDLAVAEQEVAETLASQGNPDTAVEHARIAMDLWSKADYAAPESLRRAEMLAAAR